VAEQPDKVLSDFIDAWNAGRRPRVGEYVARVEEGERDALSEQIGFWLEIAPEPELSEEAWAAIRSEPVVAAAVAAYDLESEPLADLVRELRSQRGLARGELARRVADALGMPARAVPKVESYVGSIEEGSLDPRGVSGRALEALGRALDVARSRLEAAADAVASAAAAAPAPSAAPLYRASEDADRVRESLEIAAAALSAPAPEPWDEVDRLFRGGR
jgi:transcriptional regulator with XRE-family HTH domain